MRRRWPPVLTHLLAAALFILLSIAMTWPLAPNLGSAVSDPGDPYLNAWILDWNAWAILHQPTRLFDANIFHPESGTLAFSEHLFGIAILFLPAHFVGLSAITVYNLAMIAGFAFCGYAGWLLGRCITGSALAGVVGGIAFAFVPYRFAHLAHVQITWAGWLPLILVAALAFAEKPSWKRAAALSVVFTLNGLTNVHWLLFAGIALPATMLLLAPRVPDKRTYWLRFGAAMLLSGLVLLPFLLPYRNASAEKGMRRNAAENRLGSADVREWLVADARNRTWGDTLAARKGSPERALFPGIGIIALASVALLSSRRRRPAVTPTPRGRAATRAALAIDILLMLLLVAWYLSIVDRRFDFVAGPIAFGAETWRLASLFTLFAILRLSLSYPLVLRTAGVANLRDAVRDTRYPAIWASALWVIVGFAGSLGLKSFFHMTLFRYLEPFAGIRVPARWSMIAYVGLAALAAVGTAELIRSVRRWGRSIPALPRPAARHFASAAGVIVSIGLLWELRAAPIRWSMEPAPSSAVYAWLANVPPETVIVEMPFSPPREARYVLESTTHHRRLVNGVSGFYPELHQKLAAAAGADPIPDSFLATLESIGTGLIVIHNEQFETTEPVRAWLRAAIAARRIEYIAAFEHGIGGDHVFRIARQNLALPPPPLEGIPRQNPRERLETFLSTNAPVFVNGPTGRIVGPAQWSWVPDSYTFSGQAIAAAGIERVDLLFQNRAVRVRARLVDDPGLNAQYPWLGPGQKRGYIATIPARPAGVREQTDVQVEIVDRAGLIARLTPIEFTWTRRKPVALANWKSDELDALLRRLGYDPAAHREAVLRGGLSVQALTDSVIEKNDQRTDREFVMEVYLTLLGREADPGGLRAYARELAGGRPRYEIVDDLLRSEEFARRHLQ